MLVGVAAGARGRPRAGGTRPAAPRSGRSSLGQVCDPLRRSMRAAIRRRRLGRHASPRPTPCSSSRRGHAAPCQRRRRRGPDGHASSGRATPVWVVELGATASADGLRAGGPGLRATSRGSAAKPRRPIERLMFLREAAAPVLSAALARQRAGRRAVPRGAGRRHGRRRARAHAGRDQPAVRAPAARPGGRRPPRAVEVARFLSANHLLVPHPGDGVGPDADRLGRPGRRRPRSSPRWRATARSSASEAAGQRPVVPRRRADGRAGALPPGARGRPTARRTSATAPCWSWSGSGAPPPPDRRRSPHWSAVRRRQQR